MSYKSNSIKSRVSRQSTTEFDKNREFEETIEILKAQIESLQLELCYKNHELEAMQQELKYTNQELCAAINSKSLNLAKAEELVQEFLAAEKFIKGVLVELLTATYPVKPNILVQVDMFRFRNQCERIEFKDAA
ncbi:MAG: hypothetical protein JOZ78_08845 [Chroococcidiopsidaceae cyanobacterium CP_BM_ER_R8_30]|nr:hypothetical protein [Chroococcidiopsidaceae cyanobacterium CP_BM_ER_R8_30]